MYRTFGKCLIDLILMLAIIMWEERIIGRWLQRVGLFAPEE